MTDKEMHPLTVSQCISSDWCRGYNEAVKGANDIIKRKQEEIEALINGQETLQKMCAEAYKRFAEEFEKRCIASGVYPAVIKNILKNLVKELTEVSNGE